MILRPLNDRVLIKPHEAPTETASGLQLVEHRKPEQTGTVVAVGVQAHPRKAEAERLARNMAALKNFVVVAPGNSDSDVNPLRTIRDRHEDLDATADLLRDLVRREPVVKAGDEVIFSWQAGQEIFLHDEDERYLLLREDDLLAVIED
jgi:co-chaperonin GroES (HSP10)